MIFATCPNAVQPVLGLVPPLKGPGDDLWISPSDTLAGMVCLKPPLTGKYMKALTHQGILLIGQDIEKKFRNETQLEKEKELKDQAEILIFMGELQKRKAVEEALEMQYKKLINEKDQLSIAFASQLEDELNRLQLTLNAEYQRTLTNRQRKLNEEWQDKLEQAVTDSVKELSKNFIKQLELEGNSLYEKFQLDIKKEKVKHQFELQEARKGCQESFTQLKHQLECKNIANIMYILCAERHKCRTERMIIEDNYQTEIEHLHSVISNKEERYAELLMIEEKKAIQLDQRDEYLKEILRQFQKFINFALRSSPTQAEFLLDVEKLATFQLASEGSFKAKEKCDDIPSTVITWKSDGENTETNEENVTISETQKEIIPHVNEQLVKSSDLPILHYNKHVYIREGFDDVVTSDMKISPEDFICSSGEVEALATIKVEDETIPIKDTAQLEKEETLQRTSIIFGEHQTHESDDLICPVYENIPTKLLDEATTQLEELSRTTIYKESPLFEDVQKTCCSRCTQTYINNYNAPIQRAMYNSTNDLSRVRVITSRDSLVKYRGVIKSDHHEEEDDEKIEMSRLSLARDSFIINRHTIASKHTSSQRNLDELFSEESQINETATDLKPLDRSKMSPIVSKLSVSKDSLVLLRSQSMISRNKLESKDSVEIGTCCSENESRAVKVSHFEVLTLYDKPKKGDTGFDKNLTASDSPWLTYGYKTKGILTYEPCISLVCPFAVFFIILTCV
ncbi:hypothetical protein RI129_005968 [Pyrocoelia pectoralis]|uniref:Uncharacterized protein n=1 Tax=Pyrocoelia pectoralis TaxID=417401 RepID=A0AAN7VD91_9COLE